ncbi:unnamed protein product [Heterosigma akashiwo]
MVPPMKYFRFKLRAMLACSFGFLGTHSGAHASPFNLVHACSMRDWDNWYSAAKSEYLLSLLDNDVFELVDRPVGKNIVKSRWVPSKRFENGVLKKYKGRLVAKGYSQQPGIDYDATFAPVVSAPSLHIILSLAAVNDLDLSQLDVQTAFLYGTLDEEIFLEQPELFVDKEFSDKVWRLKESLFYGLKQSPRCWYSNLHATLLEHGFARSEYEGCIYTLGFLAYQLPTLLFTSMT